MAKLRLRVSDRDALKRLARELVTPAPELIERRAAAYDAAKPAVLAAVHKRFPPRDMKVLKRYNKAAPDACIKVVDLDQPSEIVRFDLVENDAPLVADPTYRIPPYELDPDSFILARDWLEASAAVEEDYKARLADYNAFISGCRHFEDVTAVWPEAEQLRSTVEVGRSSLPVSVDVIQRVKADVAARAD